MAQHTSSKFWLTMKRHVKAVAGAVPLGTLVVVESRDMYERTQWAEGAGLEEYSTGDVVLIANRWFALPTYSEKLYSFATKLVLKSAWDEVGVIVNSGGTPHILLSGYHGVKYEPFEQFLGAREPRGCAVRGILTLQDVTQKVSPSEVDQFVREAVERKPTPWGILSAAWDSNTRSAQYRWAVQASEHAWKIRKMMGDGSTQGAIQGAKSKLHDAIVMERDFAKRLGPGEERPHRVMWNSSLVAEALQMMKLLPEPHPQATAYAPSDFSWKLPLINAKYMDALIVFKS